MAILCIVLLAVVQGLAELLPVSSSAHVIVAEKLMGRDPSSPENALLLVMLHTGTMLAVIAYFWAAWKRTFFASRPAMWRYAKLLAFSTVLTAVVGVPIKEGIERVAFRNVPKAEIEMLFGNLWLMAISLAAVGIFILFAGLRYHRATATGPATGGEANLDAGDPIGIDPNSTIGARVAGWMGAIQGLCLPFRGFSRSGATISTGMVLGGSKRRVEEFSFALAVILTPAVVAREVLRLLHHTHDQGGAITAGMFVPGLLGLACSFVAGLVALKWLSSWLEKGRWHFFGIYCLLAAAVVLVLHWRGY